MNHELKIIDMFSRIFELLLLNLLFVLTSLPLITIGASLTALFSVNLKLVKNEESYIIREYFHAFRRNLKPASITFLLFAVTSTLFSFNIILALQIRTTGLAGGLLTPYKGSLPALESKDSSNGFTSRNIILY